MESARAGCARNGALSWVGCVHGERIRPLHGRAVHGVRRTGSGSDGHANRVEPRLTGRRSTGPSRARRPNDSQSATRTLAQLRADFSDDDGLEKALNRFAAAEGLTDSDAIAFTLETHEGPQGDEGLELSLEAGGATGSYFASRDTLIFEDFRSEQPNLVCEW